MTNRAPKLATGIELGELARRLSQFGARLSGDGSRRVTGLTQDSRRVEPGDVFVARRGRRADGTEYIGDAVRRGAAAIILERDSTFLTRDVPVLFVADAERAVGFAAEAVYGDPSKALRVTGITGTNGKTTTAFLVSSLLTAVGERAARLGTLGYACGADEVRETLTTPGGDEVSRYAARALAGGAKHLVMEVSSHALAQGRVDALRFAVAAFTNLTQDHLDYHHSMAEYGSAKARLFTELAPGASVINVDDAFGDELSRRSAGRVLRVGQSPENDVHPVEVTADASGLRGTIAVSSKNVVIDSRFVGRHNLDNVMLALGIIDALGVDTAQVARALSEAPGVPGRLERCDTTADDVVVLVDYAHTPDALRRVLDAVRPLAGGKVICVFGCGGDRDPEKRPRMGDVVGRAADRAIVTNDNPRSERPEAIAESIVKGLAPHGIPFDVILDRSVAIERAIVGADAGDVVLLAGKGHEPYQIIGSESRAFDDRQQARQALERRRLTRGVHG